jgi:hypothetical protein
MISTVLIDTIPHSSQRYNTVGDWIYDEHRQKLTIYVSETGDWREALSVGVHELTEAILCLHNGVSQKSVDDFDIAFDAEARNVVDGILNEPGDDPAAPYYHEHQTATIVEKIIVDKFGLAWKLYEQHLSDLGLEWGE